MWKMNSQLLILLLVLYLSAIDHETLTRRLFTNFGARGTVVTWWFKSNRTPSLVSHRTLIWGYYFSLSTLSSFFSVIREIKTRVYGNPLTAGGHETNLRVTFEVYDVRFQREEVFFTHYVIYLKAFSV